QYTTKDGISTVIIWGYNQTQPIAKIEGAKLSDIQQSLIDSIVNASNTDALAGVNNDETSFLSALNTFRNSLSGYQVTTYTYDPLIGVRSITPPSGIRESYIYDSANRLEKVIDANGKVLKEMKYNYKN
ncbi:RHS repeat protein, partial [Chryseobacterium gallinarum]|uniref:RHS repeat domain-containing protein n=1 Tax=Chryseobacterium gallinarum TaxID=1324352 RepID=UPI002024474C